MKPQSPRLFWVDAARLALLFLALICVSGCVTDREYSQKLATTRTDWKGNEIVGIWVSKFKRTRITLMLRPDGSGRSISRAPMGNHFETNIQWHYSGEGVWAGSGQGVGMWDRFGGWLGCDFILHYNGSDLLLRDQPRLTLKDLNKMVFVRADNEAAVEEHLKKR